MTWAQKEARARRILNQTWRAASGLYPGPMPETRFGPPPGAPQPETYGTATHPGYVELSNAVVKDLARPKFMYPKARANARETLLHEWAHAYQKPEILDNANSNLREEAATLFSTYWAHKLFGADPMTRRGPLPYQNRRAASRDLASVYGGGYWQRGQFK